MAVRQFDGVTIKGQLLQDTSGLPPRTKLHFIYLPQRSCWWILQSSVSISCMPSSASC